jgi:hypothetical protein
MDIVQRKYLEDRLRKAANDHENSFRRPKVPSRVILARKIVARWDHSDYAARMRHVARIAKVRKKVTELILFGDARSALKAIRAFEKKKF